MAIKIRFEVNVKLHHHHRHHHYQWHIHTQPVIVSVREMPFIYAYMIIAVWFIHFPPGCLFFLLILTLILFSFFRFLCYPTRCVTVSFAKPCFLFIFILLLYFKRYFKFPHSNMQAHNLRYVYMRMLKYFFHWKFLINVINERIIEWKILFGLKFQFV